MRCNLCDQEFDSTSVNHRNAAECVRQLQARVRVLENIVWCLDEETRWKAIGQVRERICAHSLVDSPIPFELVDEPRGPEITA